jgi:hypothetical protein
MFLSTSIDHLSQNRLRSKQTANKHAHWSTAESEMKMYSQLEPLNDILMSQSTAPIVDLNGPLVESTCAVDVATANSQKSLMALDSTTATSPDSTRD